MADQPPARDRRRSSIADDPVDPSFFQNKWWEKPKDESLDEVDATERGDVTPVKARESDGEPTEADPLMTTLSVPSGEI